VVGDTATPAPLVTAPKPLIAPVPPENVGVRVVEVPLVMVAAPPVKLVMVGGGTTVTVTVAVAVVPAVLVTVKV
jgi:hypothetical protein